MRNMEELFKDANLRRRLQMRMEEGWDFDMIEPMSTDEVFAKLNRLGIAVTPEEFRQAAQRHESAERLACEWRERYPFRPEGRYDEDFVWMAAIILWKRLLPDRICFEQIDDRMQKGYRLLEQGSIAEACDAWWQVWEWIKDKVTPERDTLETLDADFRGMQAVFNWCQDFEMELGNAGVGDAEYHRLRIRYCQEFLGTFSGIDWWMQASFLRAEAESYWGLGEIETAEAKFEALIEADPDWAWGYIGWSDLHWLFLDGPKNYDCAESILQRALKRPNVEDREDVLARLESLRAERAQAGGRRKRRKRRR